MRTEKSINQNIFNAGQKEIQAPFAVNYANAVSVTKLSQGNHFSNAMESRKRPLDDHTCNHTKVK